jgi:hypothetical protein
MRLVKSIAVGVAAGILASALVIAVQFALSLGALRISERGTGGGVEGGYLDLTPSLRIGLLTAVAAFVSRWRRYRRISLGR